MFSEKHIKRSEAGPLQCVCFWVGNSNGLKQGRFNVCVHVASNSNGLKQDRFNLHVLGRKLKRSETGPLQFLVFLTENPNGLLDPRCDLRYRLKVEFDGS